MPRKRGFPYTNLAGGINESVSELQRPPNQAKSILDWHFDEFGALIKRKGPARVVIHPVGYTNISDMESDETWTHNGAMGGSLYTDTVNFKEGVQSVGIAWSSPDGSAEHKISRTVSLDLGLNEQQYIEFWVYAYIDGTRGLDDLLSGKLYLKFKVGDYYSTQFHSASSPLSAGWNFFRVEKADFDKTGFAKWDSITEIVFELVANSSLVDQPLRVVFDDLILNPCRTIRGLWDYNGDIIVAVDSGIGVTSVTTELFKNNGTTGWTSLKSGLGDSHDYHGRMFDERLVIINGIDADMKYDGTSVTDLGVDKPSAPPVLVEGVAGVLDGTYKYNFRYYSSTTGHESDPADDDRTITVASKKVELSAMPATTHTDYDKKRIYRTKAGFGTLLRLAEIDNSQTTYSDDNADTALGVEMDTDSGKPPVAGSLEVHDNRAWFGKQASPNNELINFSKNDESQSVDAGSDFLRLISGSGESNVGLIAVQDTLFAFSESHPFAVFKTGSDKTPYRIKDIKLPVGLHGSRALSRFLAGFLAYGNRKLYNYTGGGFDSKFSKRVIDFLSSATLNHTLRSRAVMYHVEALNQVRLSVIRAGETLPDRVLVWDYFNDAFTVFRRNVTAAAEVVWNGSKRLLVGNEIGYVAEEDAALDDDGLDIDADFDWTWLDQGDPHTLKRYRNAYLFFTGNGAWTIDGKFFLDYDNTAGETFQETLTPGGMIWGQWRWGTAKWGRRDADMIVVGINDTGRAIKFQIEAKGAGKQVDFLGMVVEAQILKSRPF